MILKSLKASVGKLFSPVETKSATVPIDAWGLEGFLTTSTHSGVSVTPETAMRVPAVNAAVALIASTIKTLPAKLFERVEESKVVAADHPAHRFVHRYANDWTSAGQLRSQLTHDALLHGDGFAIANRADSGRVVDFTYVPPGAMSVKADGFNPPVYTLSTTGGIRRYDFRDVLHLRAITSFDGVTGSSPISLCREAIALALVMEEHGSKLFREGARPSAVASYPAEATKTLPGTDGERVRKNLIQAARLGMAGVENSGKLAITFDGAVVTPLAFSSVDAQFLELRRFAIDEIARAFRVPPTMLFELGRGTWGNTEQMGQQFVSYTLLPWIEAWQDAYARVLLDPETDDDLSVEFIVDDLLRADTATRFTAYSKAIASRILNPNEVRALENRAPYDGGDLFLNPNTTTGAEQPVKEAA